MAVRATEIIEDCQRCIEALIAKLCSTTVPWTSWTSTLGRPETDRWELASSFIYTMEPYFVEITGQQQGGSSLAIYEVIIGTWNNRKSGGAEEINIMTSRIQNLFQVPATWSTAFTITINSVVFTDTTLRAQGIGILGITGARQIETEEKKEFRNEQTLRFIA